MTSELDDAKRQPLPTLPLSPDAMVNVFAVALQAGSTESPGTIIGPFKLLQKIGEGGFGVVWMAEQQAPIRRRVALKIIKQGMDTKEVITRFEAERQALALMDHPGIARVFEAGATDSGRPFFVMELVRGIAITHYCDESRLPTEARLRLFVTVCQAVQHAHQKGVIHRDLKPSNILVTLHDGVPVPKVIDFGIAKATSAHLTDKTLFTQFKAFMGTPAYTSPEQMEMSGLDVDTRSDIYSLGVLLYELLAGRTPFDPDLLAKSGLDAMRRTIREIDPPRPSARLSTLSAADRSTVAQQRGTDSAKLSILLRGDLDWIVMHCLEKDRTRRYDTANGLAMDAQRHLVNEPVAARPPSSLYRARKFVRRHRVGVAAVAAVGASLVAGLLVASALFVRERMAHDRALAAEMEQGKLRQQAETARIEEVKRAARTSLDLANQSLAGGRVTEGLAYLVYAAQKDPSNTILASRLASVLSAHNFALPERLPFECGSRAVAMRYASDGATFMVGTEDGTMRVFDSATGDVIREFRTGKPVWWINGWLFATANDKNFAARFQDNSVAVFDSLSGRQLAPTIRLDPAAMLSPDTFGLSPDGRWLVSRTGSKFWVWDVFLCEQRVEQSFGSIAANSYTFDFDFSPDGRRLCTVIGNKLTLWSLPDFHPIFESMTIKRPRTEANLQNLWLFARFFPDSQRLALCDVYEGIRIFDPVTGFISERPFAAVEDGFGRKAWEFSPDGRLLHAGTTGEILDLDSGSVTPLPLPSGGDILEKSFSRDGSLILTASNNKLVHLWDTKTGKSIAEVTSLLQTSLCALSPDGTQIVICTIQGAVHRLRVGRGIAQPWILPRTMPAMPVAFFPDRPARLLALTSARARVLDVATGREIAGGFSFPRKITTNVPGEGDIKSPIRPDLRFLIVRNGPDWEAWEFLAEGKIRVVTLHGNLPRGGIPIFSPTGDLVAIAGMGRIVVCHLRTGDPVGLGIDEGRGVWFPSINFSPDGRRLGVGYVGAPAVWEVATGQPVTSTVQQTSNTPLISVQFSPDGGQIATGDRKGEARLWDAETGAALSPILFHADMLSKVCFTPDGRLLVTRSSTEVRIWDAKTAAPVARPIPLFDGRDLRFSSDSRFFVAVSENGNAQIFDVRTAQAFSEPLSHGAVRLPTVFFSPDSLFVRTETTAPDFRIWSVPPALPEGTPIPEWLLQLATVCAGKIVNDQGQLVPLTDNAARLAKLRPEIAALPGNAPLANWGQWILNDRPDRSIAPGFTMTATEAAKLAGVLTTP